MEEEAKRLSKKYGQHAGSIASTRIKYDVVPTGSLALDYALGTGGWPLRRIVHIYGLPDVGKSSSLGLAAFASAQKLGLSCGLIAVEPGFDPDWATKNGVNPELLIVARPNNGEEAFHILYDWCTGNVVDFIIFDSIGAVSTASEDQKEGKARVGGASGLITSGVRSITSPVFNNNKGLIFLNQARDDLKSPYGGIKPPGGHLLQHAADVHVQLRQSSGSESFRKIKIDGDDVIVGRNLTAHITRNKLTEGTGQKARFWYNSLGTAEFGPVGMDTWSDIISTAMRTRVIRRGGAFYYHDSFPDGKLQGQAAVETFLREHPKIVEKIRAQVLAIMESGTPIDSALEPEGNDG